jgi:hypothetical protein
MWVYNWKVVTTNTIQTVYYPRWCIRRYIGARWAESCGRIVVFSHTVKASAIVSCPIKVCSIRGGVGRLGYTSMSTRLAIWSTFYLSNDKFNLSRLTGSLGCWSHLDPITSRLKGVGVGTYAAPSNGQYSLKDVVYQDAGIYKCVGQSPTSKKKLEVLNTIALGVKGEFDFIRNWKLHWPFSVWPQ